MRVAGIDVFRGLSIILMVIFTMIQRLSDSLPDLLVHYRTGALHIGDMVLPMFLFASGMSLVFFHRKRQGKGKLGYALDVMERAGKLAFVWFFLSPFTSGEALGMDEIILSVLLFIPSAILVGCSAAVIALAALLPVIGYFFLSSAYSLPDFSLHYLGGYAALPFYLPVMLAGVLAGKSLDNGGWGRRTDMLFAACAAVTLVLLFLVMPYKLGASPSFMALSVMFSFVVFRAVGHAGNGFLEYLGQKPLRYWILMHVMVGIPLSFYEALAGATISGTMTALEAVLVSLACCAIMFAGSRAIDAAASLFPKPKTETQKKRGQPHI